jgi:hypothetical protein
MSDPADLGPLTTVFTPPPDCTASTLFYGYVYGDYRYYLLRGQSCRSYETTMGFPPLWAPSCWPSGMAQYIQSQDKIKIPYYSPGQSCPSGFTSACSMTKQEGDRLPPTDRYLWTVLSTNETAIVCCPTYVIYCHRIPHNLITGSNATSL